MRIALLLLGVFAAGICAAEFDAVTFYGRDYYTPTAALEGKLSLKLASNGLPPFVDLSNSDEGPVLDRFEFTATGLVLKPAKEKTTCEAELDVGVTQCSATVDVVELDVGASVAFHLHGLGEGALEYLIEVKRAESSTRLSIRTHTRNGFAEISGADAAGVNFKVANNLSFTASGAKLSATFGGAKVDAAANPGAFSLAIAANDGRTRVSDLQLTLHFDEAWADDAQARLQARLVLARLSEYCTQGLLAGVNQSKLPTQEADLKQYSNVELKARADALADANFASRHVALDALAKAKPKVTLAAYEAGVAAMLAGYSFIARERLEAALAISDCSLVQLVLAEACRRMHDFDNAKDHLVKAQAGMEERILPDYELLRGRLLAARGDIAGSRKVLVAAQDKWKQHAQLEAFAESANELVEPHVSAYAGEGPFGLTLLSDLDDGSIRKLLARLKPYLERIRHWLPELAKKLDGTIAIYATPTGYLRAALLVAGDSLDNIAGMFLPAGIGGGRSVIACRAFGEDELVRTLSHELWHLAVSTTGQAAVEPWLNEGMAVYISSGLVDGGVLKFDELPSEFSPIEYEMPPAFANAMASSAAIDADLEHFYLPGTQRMNYAMAWALVWYHAEKDMASERVLRELLAGSSTTRKTLKDGLAQLLPKVAKALHDRKILPSEK